MESQSTPDSRSVEAEIPRPAPSPRDAGSGEAEPFGTRRHLVLVIQVGLVVAVLALWLGVDSLRESRSLWMLFLYCLPSEFLVATVPHEPVMLLYARFTEPLVVAAISLAGTVMTEALNYSVIRYLADTRPARRLIANGAVRRSVDLFRRAPFVALVVAAATPVPFYPFRFLVVMSGYPVFLYLLAVIVGRTPRFYLIALFGDVVEIPDGWLIGLFVALVAAMYLPPLIKRARARRAARASE